MRVPKQLTRSQVFSSLVLTTVLAGAFAGYLLAADLTGPSSKDRNISNIVTALVEHQHLTGHELNDEISQRGFDSFLKNLDPMKLYFYQADYDEFAQKRNELDDMLKAKDTSFAYAVFSRFKKRVDERVSQVPDLLKTQHDFTVDEEMVTDPDLVKYPRDEAEARDRWRRRIKYDLLVLKADKVEGDEAIQRLTRRYENFARRMSQFDNDELLEMFLTAITTSYDPHTTYMSPSTLDNFRISLGLALEGIGAQLRDTDGQTVVAKIIPGGAADKHGKIKPEDKIVSVGQEDEGEMVDIVDMKLNDVVKLIRGKAGTVVRLGVVHAGTTETKVYKIVRAKVDLKDSAAQSEVFEFGDRGDGAPFKIGVIDLPSFYMDMEGARAGSRDYRSTTRDVRAILDQFKKDRVNAVVLDLRRNGGGSLTEAINLTGLFIDYGPVVQVKGSDDGVQHYDDINPGMAWDGPLVVMTSKLSASASEILAGAIQDYRRGLIVGDRSTHGKGTVQSLLDLGPQLIGGPDPPNLGALKITLQQFYRPNGDSTQMRGVLADITLPSLTDKMDVGESDLDYAIEFHRVKQAQFKQMDLVNDDLLNALRSGSQERRKGSDEFNKLLRRIDRYVAQKSKKRVTLNEEKFFAERKEFDAEKEDERQLQEQADGGDGKIERDYYLDEIFSITVDYLRALENNKVAVR